MRGSVAPLAIDAYPYCRVGLDVVHVIRMLAVFRNHPELVVHHASADRRAPRLPALAASGFEHGHRQLPADRIDHQPLDAVDHLPFQNADVGHISDSAVFAKATATRQRRTMGCMATDGDGGAEQQLHWDSTYSAHPAMYGAEPSAPAVYAAKVFRDAGAQEVVELGAGHGRDALFFAREGFAVHALDFSATGLRQLSEAGPDSGNQRTRQDHRARRPHAATVARRLHGCRVRAHAFMYGAVHRADPRRSRRGTP